MPEVSFILIRQYIGEMFSYSFTVISKIFFTKGLVENEVSGLLNRNSSG